MRYFLIVFLFIGIQTNQVKACDVCGCALNSSGGEVIPGLFNHYIGVRSNIRSFTSRHLTLFPNETPMQTNEWFHTTELHGMYSPKRRIQLFGFLPYNAVIKNENDQKHITNGLGDLRIRGNYLWVDKKEADTMLTIFTGLTVKTPTGRHQYKDGESINFHRNMLPGTGTVDFGFHSDLIYAKGKLGGMLNVSYLLRGTHDNYAFGNAFLTQATFFLKQPLKKSSLLLEGGISFADLKADEDLRYNEKQIYSQGWLLSPMIRVSYFKGKWAGVLSFNKAVSQDMAMGQVEQNYQLDINLIRFF